MGPLHGVRVVEIAGIGPGPFCGMMLSDMGADVVRLDRLTGSNAPVDIDHRKDIVGRGRRAVALDLKSAEGQAMALEMIERADMVFEGFRPGVVERLGLGPDACLARNPRLVYGRMTGWGQTGPLAQRAGHDINYIALAGVLGMVGRAGEAPVPPLNLVGDYGGGGMLLAFGMVCALIEARTSGRGQVVDAAMFEGSALLMAATRAMMEMGHWGTERGRNMCDSGAHFYEVYETRDGGHMAVGAIEPQFYAQLLTGLGIAPDDPEFGKHFDARRWSALKSRLQSIFATRTRTEWTEIFAETDACVTPVLSVAEASEHPHAVARQSYLDIAGVTHPAPAPRFSRTAPEVVGPTPATGQGGAAALIEWGISNDDIDDCIANGAMLNG